MKDYNRLVVLVGIMLFCGVTVAQRSDWTLGFRMGYKVTTLEKNNPSDLGIISTFGDNTSPTIELNLMYNINKNISLTSGITYLEYYGRWRNGDRDKWYAHGGSIFLKYAQIPLILKYAISLGKSNFSVYGKLGFNFDILAYTSLRDLEYEIASSHYAYDYFYEYRHKVKFYDKKMNILLNTGIGIGYRFKNGLGVSIEGDYNTGLRTMGEILIECNKKTTGFDPVVLQEYRDFLLFKGDYWNFS